MKDEFRHIREAYDYMVTAQERALVDDVDRCLFEIRVAAVNYAAAVRALDRFRDQQASKLADQLINAGKNPF